MLSLKNKQYSEKSIILFILSLYFPHYYLFLFSRRFLIASLLGSVIGSFHSTHLKSFKVENTAALIIGDISEIDKTEDYFKVTLKNVQSLYNISKVRIYIPVSYNSNLEIGDIFSGEVFFMRSSYINFPFGYDFANNMHIKSIDGFAKATIPPKIIKIRSSSLNKLRANIKNYLIANMRNGDFISALMVGDSSAISEEKMTKIRNSGISHVLCVSGLHLSLVAFFTYFSMRFLLNFFCVFQLYVPNINKISATLSIVVSGLYLLISGMAPSAIRAFIMTTFVLISIVVSRSVNPIRSVLTAACIILSFEPLQILNPSFVLSFTAVIALIKGHTNHSSFIKSNIKSTFLAGNLTSPFSVYFFFNYPVYSVIANLIIVPVVSFILMPMVVLSFIFGNLFFIPMDLCVDFILFIVNQINQLPLVIYKFGYIESHYLLMFTIGFLIWGIMNIDSGIIVMISACIIIFFADKPIKVIDHKNQVLILKDGTLISNRKQSNFYKNYVMGWIGSEQVVEIIVKDKISEVKSGFTFLYESGRIKYFP